MLTCLLPWHAGGYGGGGGGYGGGGGGGGGGDYSVSCLPLPSSRLTCCQCSWQQGSWPGR
jgi:hypothetical protein